VRFETIRPDTLSLFWLKATKDLLDMPIMIGSMILAHSKVWMSRIHYYIKSCFPEKAYDMLYTDTDSFMMRFTMSLPEVQAAIKKMDASVPFPEHFTPGTPLWDAKKPGLLKDENGGKPMYSLTVPSPKTYSFRIVAAPKPSKTTEPTTSDEEEDVNVEGDAEQCDLPGAEQTLLIDEQAKAAPGIAGTMKAKGVFSSVLKKQVTDKDYTDVVLHGKTVTVDVTQIQSKLLKVRTLQSRKIAANNFYDKRAVLSDGMETRAYGHYILRSQADEQNTGDEGRAQMDQLEQEQEGDEAQLVAMMENYEEDEAVLEVRLSAMHASVAVKRVCMLLLLLLRRLRLLPRLSRSSPSRDMDVRRRWWWWWWC